MDNTKIDLVIKKFEEIGIYYKVINYPTVTKEKFSIIDNMGYKYTNTYAGLLKNIKRGSKMDKVSSWNPYSIENIKLFLQLNLSYVHLKETEFKKAKSRMLFKCDICGEFYSTWDDINHNNGCPQCNLNVKHTDAEVEEKIKIYSKTIGINYKWIGGEYKSSSIKNLILIDELGYKYKASYNTMDNIRDSKICTFDYRNPFIIDNIKLYLLKNKPHIILKEDKITNSIGENCLKFYCLIHNKYFECKLFALFSRNGCPECAEIPKGEQKIIDYFKTNEINYEFQQKYDGLLGLSNGLLSYDFYLPNYNLLIEYQGEQHERPVDFKSEGIEVAKERFKKQQEHDRRKKEYAQLHNIDLLEIWYWDFDNVEEILFKELNNFKDMQITL